MIQRVASKWYELGIELYKEADVPQLDIIKKQHPGDLQEACTKMLSYWRETYQDATWNSLIKALGARGLQLNANAIEIKRDVMNG